MEQIIGVSIRNDIIRVFQLSSGELQSHRDTYFNMTLGQKRYFIMDSAGKYKYELMLSPDGTYIIDPPKSLLMTLRQM